MAILERATNMKPPLGFYVRCMRFFRRIESSEMVIPTVGFKFCSPALCPFVKGNAKKSACVVGSWTSLVLRINCWISKTQIVESVIRSIAIDVVKHVGRPLTSHVQPCKAMRKESRSVNADRNVAASFNASNRSCTMSPMPTNGNATHKRSDHRVVIKKFAQSLRGKIRFSHDALLSLIGQRPASVFSTARASLF